MEYNVHIIRTSRKSLSLSVSSENEIVVRCPKSVSENRINSFIESKKNWLNKIVARNDAEISRNRSVIEHKDVLVGGIKLPIYISDKNAITSDGVYLKNLKYIKPAFISHFSEGFVLKVKEISELTGLRVNSISVRAYKARWGCCDAEGNIRFNYLLFMLPFKLQRYVIIHELCHTVFLNHSVDFWRLVARFEPDYKKSRKLLKGYDFITNLY